MARILHITGKCSDCSFTSIPHLDVEHEGYVPESLGIGGDDYIKIAIDLDTGKILDFPDLSTDEKLKEVLRKNKMILDYEDVL